MRGQKVFCLGTEARITVKQPQDERTTSRRRRRTDTAHFHWQLSIKPPHHADRRTRARQLSPSGLDYNWAVSYLNRPRRFRPGGHPTCRSITSI